MVLIHPKVEPQACREFEATIYLLFHANQIHKGFQATVHIGNVCQTAHISYMDRVSLQKDAKYYYRSIKTFLRNLKRTQ